MSPFVSRAKRATRECLGLLWPRTGPPTPDSYEEQIYAAVIREGDISFDIGANVGAVSLFLARLAGPSGLVVAFEPLWPVYARLCRNIQGDRHFKAPIITLPYGVADKTKTATLQIPNGVFEMASLAEPKLWTEAQRGARLMESRCDFLSIDAFLEGGQFRVPHFVKIDVEGAELLVLRGASRFFAGGHRPLMLIELFAPWERAFGYEPWDVLSLLSALKYRFLFACPEGLVEHEPVRTTPFPREFEWGYNIVAFASEMHQDRVRSLNQLRIGGSVPRLPMTPPPHANRLTEPERLGS
jgi:FkbM family methyltransferase